MKLSKLEARLLTWGSTPSTTLSAQRQKYPRKRMSVKPLREYNVRI